MSQRIHQGKEVGCSREAMSAIQGCLQYKADRTIEGRSCNAYASAVAKRTEGVWKTVDRGIEA